LIPLLQFSSVYSFSLSIRVFLHLIPCLLDLALFFVSDTTQETWLAAIVICNSLAPARKKYSGVLPGFGVAIHILLASLVVQVEDRDVTSSIFLLSLSLSFLGFTARASAFLLFHVFSTMYVYDRDEVGEMNRPEAWRSNFDSFRRYGIP